MPFCFRLRLCLSLIFRHDPAPQRPEKPLITAFQTAMTSHKTSDHLSAISTAKKLAQNRIFSFSPTLI
jgi:hypothetical protein